MSFQAVQKIFIEEERDFKTQERLLFVLHLLYNLKKYYI